MKKSSKIFVGMDAHCPDLDEDISAMEMLSGTPAPWPRAIV